MKLKSKALKPGVKEIVEQRIFDTIGDAVSIQDINFRILYQNEKAKKIIGDHVGEFCYKAFENRDAVCEGCPLALSFRDGKVRTVERSNPAAGRELIVEITTSVIKNSAGKIAAGIEVVRDITERKQIEKSIEQAKREWEETFDIVNDAITIHDMDFNIIRANRAAEKMLGMEFLKIFSQKCYISYHGQNHPPFNCPSCQTLRSGTPTTTELFEPNLGKHIEIRALPRFDNDKIIGVVHIVRDISQRKLVEEERNKLINELRNALAKVKALSGLLSICASCNKIRDDEGNWNHLEIYISEHSDADFSHGLCPECVRKLYPKFYKKEN